MAIDIHHINPGDTFDDYFIVHTIQKKEFKNKPGEFLAVDLVNPFGHIPMNVWDATDRFLTQCRIGDVIKVRVDTPHPCERTSFLFKMYLVNPVFFQCKCLDHRTSWMTGV